MNIFKIVFICCVFTLGNANTTDGTKETLEKTEFARLQISMKELQKFLIRFEDVSNQQKTSNTFSTLVEEFLALHSYKDEKEGNISATFKNQELRHVYTYFYASTMDASPEETFTNSYITHYATWMKLNFKACASFYKNDEQNKKLAEDCERLFDYLDIFVSTLSDIRSQQFNNFKNHFLEILNEEIEKKEKEAKKKEKEAKKKETKEKEKLEKGKEKEAKKKETKEEGKEKETKKTETEDKERKEKEKEKESEKETKEKGTEKEMKNKETKEKETKEKEKKEKGKEKEAKKKETKEEETKKTETEDKERTEKGKEKEAEKETKEKGMEKEMKNKETKEKETKEKEKKEKGKEKEAKKKETKKEETEDKERTEKGKEKEAEKETKEKGTEKEKKKEKKEKEKKYSMIDENRIKALNISLVPEANYECGKLTKSHEKHHCEIWVDLLNKQPSAEFRLNHVFFNAYMNIKPQGQYAFQIEEFLHELNINKKLWNDASEFLELTKTSQGNKIQLNTNMVLSEIIYKKFHYMKDVLNEADKNTFIQTFNEFIAPFKLNTNPDTK